MELAQTRKVSKGVGPLRISTFGPDRNVSISQPPKGPYKSVPCRFWSSHVSFHVSGGFEGILFFPLACESLKVFAGQTYMKYVDIVTVCLRMY